MDTITLFGTFCVKYFLTTFKYFSSTLEYFGVLLEYV